MVQHLEPARKKIGLALGSGAARGLAHIGVLAALEQAGIKIDMVAGTSMGSVIGAVYAGGRTVAEMRTKAAELGEKRFSLFVSRTLPKNGLIHGRKVEDILRSIIGDKEFKDLDIPFACVASDIHTGQEVVLDYGPVRKAVRASCSIPVMFNVVERDGRYLIDGGLINPVPVSVVRAMGADFVIAVNVLPDESKLKQDVKDPNIFTVIMQTLHLASYRGVKLSLVGADAVIEPDVAHISALDLHRSDECYWLGYMATRDAIKGIKTKLAGG